MEDRQRGAVFFSPDRWGELERFIQLCGGTYSFSKHQQGLVAGARNHLYKAQILINLAKGRSSLLEEDNKQLEEYGHTAAIRGRELSAVLETVILEIYASVDCSRGIVSHLYKKKKGIADSTRKLFKNAFDNKIDASVPYPIRNAFATAHWYDDFRRLRDALAHSDIGSCHLDTSGVIVYMHPQLGDNTKVLVIEDIFSYVESLFGHVNRFTGSIFHFLNSTLSDAEVWQMCGIFDGRIYSRYVRPSEAHDIHSGRCDAYRWFEEPGNPLCPLMDSCGAYRNRFGKATGAPDTKPAK
jgi:hypothetical protein